MNSSAKQISPCRAQILASGFFPVRQSFLPDVLETARTRRLGPEYAMRTGLGKPESGPRSLCRGPADAPLVERLPPDGRRFGRTISNPPRPAEGKPALTLLADCLILHQIFLKKAHHFRLCLKKVFPS
jgi:hypothetical protein